jgi:flavodoxin I
MKSIGLFYGSTNGTTAQVAELMGQAFTRLGVTCEIFDIAEYYLDEMLTFDCLILGIPTWNVGQLQADWEAVFDEFDELNFSGKQVALFGLGDQVGYPNTFVDALAFLADKVRERGAELVGAWPTDTYSFSQSWAVTDGQFVGLVLDEHHQAEQTPLRIAQWVQQLLREFRL